MFTSTLKTRHKIKAQFWKFCTYNFLFQGCLSCSANGVCFIRLCGYFPRHFSLFPCLVFSHNHRGVVDPSSQLETMNVKGSKDWRRITEGVVTRRRFARECDALFYVNTSSLLPLGRSFFLANFS